MPTSAQNLTALRAELRRVEGRRNPRKRASDLDGLTFLDIGEDVDDLVNGEFLEGMAAKVIGTVKYPPKGMYPDVTSVVLIATGGDTFNVLLFDDEAVYQQTVYRNIPTRKLADRLARSLWASHNMHAQRVDRELMDAQEKYGVKKRPSR
jgi:hypothetical protein